MQKGLRVITLQGAIEKSPILLTQCLKNDWLDGIIIISYFGGSNNIFADCNWSRTLKMLLPADVCSTKALASLLVKHHTPSTFW